MKNDTAIEVSEVSKSFGAVRAVDTLSFDVQCGEIFAMLGPNGAGKTTTIRMILDILKPDSGRIGVFGGKINPQSKDRIGYLPEERGLYRDVSVVDCLTYLGELKGMRAADAKSKAMALLERLELADVASKKVKELSRGMQQKAQFAAAVLHGPDLIIIDEPFSGLDPVNTLLIKDLIYAMRDEGRAVVMSTHQMHQVEEMADRLLMVHRGKRVLYGTVDEVRQRFAINAVVVEGEGDWSTVPGVINVDRADNGREYHLMLDAGVTPDNVMRALADSPHHHVRRFEQAIPSMNEIFIQVVREIGGELNGDRQ